MQVMKEPDPIKREEIRARVTKEELPFYLSKFEKIVQENGGFSVGNDVSRFYNNLFMSSGISYD